MRGCGQRALGGAGPLRLLSEGVCRVGRERLQGARAGPRSVVGAGLALGRGPELFLEVEKIEGSPSLSPTSRLALWVRAMWDEVPWPSGPGGGDPETRLPGTRAQGGNSSEVAPRPGEERVLETADRMNRIQEAGEERGRGRGFRLSLCVLICTVGTILGGRLSGTFYFMCI